MSLFYFHLGTQFMIIGGKFENLILIGVNSSINIKMCNVF
jgi:hypothetical protein